MAGTTFESSELIAAGSARIAEARKAYAGGVVLGDPHAKFASQVLGTLIETLHFIPRDAIVEPLPADWEPNEAFWAQIVEEVRTRHQLQASCSIPETAA